ncbi:unnamed protein product, partial [Ranitomeya imitator]
PPSSSFIMALWIQYLRLAVLLILLTTQARSTPHLRGSQLADALYMVCRETGFYQPKVGRDLEQPLDSTGGEQRSRAQRWRTDGCSYPMFTLVTGIVGRWRAVCVTALQRPNSDAAAIRIVVVNGAQGSEMDGMQDYPIIKGGIVERCCYGACSYYDLLKYCN